MPEDRTGTGIGKLAFAAACVVTSAALGCGGGSSSTSATGETGTGDSGTGDSGTGDAGTGDSNLSPATLAGTTINTDGVTIQLIDGSNARITFFDDGFTSITGTGTYTYTDGPGNTATFVATFNSDETFAGTVVYDLSIVFSSPTMGTATGTETFSQPGSSAEVFAVDSSFIVS